MVEALIASEEGAARAPDRGLALVGVGDQYIPSTGLQADFGDFLIDGFDLFAAVAVEGQEQVGVGRVIGKFFAQILFGAEDHRLLHVFDRRRDVLGADDDGDGFDGRREIGEGDQQADGFLGQRQQFEQGFCDEAERAFGADDQILDAVTRAVFHDLAADLDDVAVGEYHFEAAHVVARDAVFDGAHASGVGADVAADRGAFLAGVGRIEEVAFFDKFGDLHQQHAGLYSQREVVFIQFGCGSYARAQHDAVTE